MKGRQIVLGRLNGEEAAALMQDGQLVDLILEPGPQKPLVPGAICRGVVERLMKGRGGGFVRLPDGQRGYLRERSGLREGKPMLVQISGMPEEGKAIPLSSRLIFRGRFALITPTASGVNVSRRIRDDATRDALQSLAQRVLAGRGHGVILRSAAEIADEGEIEAELAPLIDLADRIVSETEGGPELLLDAATPWEQAWTEWAHPEPDAVEEGEASFDDCGVTDAIDALLASEVPLPQGANAIFEVTRALVAVDVNTGTDTTPAAGLKANIALARDLSRQFRLRGLGGQIVIDFAPMPKRDRATLEQVLRAVFKGDGTETALVGWTKMGLYEINRKRDRMPLQRLTERR